MSRLPDPTTQPSSAAPPPAPAGENLAGHAIIFAGVALLVACILTNRAFHTMNDNSRWDTVWNLVHRGTYAIDGGPWGDKERVEIRRRGSEVFPEPHVEGPWVTIDMVRWTTEQADGTQETHSYSSKPPFLSTLVAGLYYAVWKVSDVLDGPGPGLRIAYFRDDATGDATRRVERDRYGNKAEPGNPVGRILLIVINIIPFIIFLQLYRQLLEKSAYGMGTKMFCLVFAAFGTYLTAYCRTFTNHTVAAFAAFFAVYCALRIWYAGQRRWDLFAGAGLFAGLAAASELPATALLAGLLVYLLIASPGRTLAFYVPAAALPVGAFLLTNYLALGNVVPAQAYQFTDDARYRELYHFEGSYWNHMMGIDAADEPKPVYAAHMLIGHHGIFSLTPVLLISMIGIIQHLFARERTLRSLHVLVFLITLVVLLFYIFKTNNYGGGAQGLRWTFWLIPLWLIALPRGVDTFFRSRFTTVIALVLLGISVFSAMYATVPPLGPWSQSWLHWLLEYFEIVKYT